MQLTSPRAPRKPTQKKRSAREKEFEKAWNRVLDQQQKNAMLREEVQAFSCKVSAKIQEHEQAYVQAQCQTCEHLLSFCGRKSLTGRQQASLMDWIMDYLVNIAGNPFSEPADLAALRQRVEEEFSEYYPDVIEEEENFADDPEFAEMEDMFGDLFGEFAGAAGLDDDLEDLEEDDFDPFEEAMSGVFEQQQRAREAARQAEGAAVKEMMKASSISRLFRKVARVLHPDRERDEDARQEKNRLMSVLLHARQTNDIPTIFSLYAEHVGESPLQELTGDLKGITQLLQRQYEHLREQKDEIIDEDPFSAVLYRRFYRKSSHAVQRSLQKYVNDLETETRNILRMRAEVSTLSKLKRYLGRRFR